MTNASQGLTMLRSGRLDTNNLPELVEEGWITQDDANIFGREEVLREASNDNKEDYADLAKCIPAIR